MTQLLDAFHTLGLQGETSNSGRWVKFQSQHCQVYVVEAPWQSGYYTWCDDAQGRTERFYRDALEAIQEGLRRASA